MIASLQRYVSAGVLMVWGVVISYFFFSGRVGSYLHPSFHTWTVASGIILVLMAGGILFLPQALDACPEEECLHTFGGKTWWGIALAGIILVVPLLVTTVVSPSQFGAALVMNRGMIDSIGDLPGYIPYAEPPLPTEDGSQPANPVETQPTASYLPLNEAGQIKAQSVDLLYAAQEPTMREDFENKEVELIGQFMPAKSNNPKGDRFNLVRMFVMCCAADSRPVAVTVQAPKTENFPEMSWIKVTGKATFPTEAGRMVPVVVADQVTATDPPEESFIY